MGTTSLVLCTGLEHKIEELQLYALQHKCGSLNKSQIIRACINMTYDICTRKETHCSLLKYFDDQKEIQ